MKVQDFDDWQRMLDVLAIVAGLNGDAATNIKDVLTMLENGPEWKHNGEPCPVKWWGVKKSAWRDFWRVARALGIDVRRRLEWGPTIPADYREAVVDGDRAALAGDGTDGTWTACVFQRPNGANLLRVTGHPTRESAIMHLERLLGREP